MRAIFLAMSVAGLVSANAYSQGTLTPIRVNGPTANRINVVVLSEGYQSSELGKFLVDATNAVKNLLSVPPYGAYSNYFNAYAISVASAQSGSDHYTPATTLVSTYFNSTFDSYGIQRLITIPPNDRDGNYANGQGKVMSLLQALMPEYDLVMLLVNDAQYGGSGGSILISSLNSSSAEVVRHESGHTFGDLADEYSSAYPGWTPTEYPNVTALTNRSSVRWNAWIAATTPVPTPATSTYTGTVGLFEGAQYQTKGWFRPKYDCKMNHLNVPFCEVCSEQVVKSIYSTVRPVDAFSPVSTSLSMLTQDAQTFEVIPQLPVPNSLAIQWTMDGTDVVGATQSSFVLNAAEWGVGNHTINVRVADLTSAVRSDPSHILTASYQWNVSIAEPGALPTILAQPSSQAVAPGATATFSVSVSSASPVSYQWNKNGVALSGATGSSYTRSNVQTADAGSYTVRVTNASGSVTSEPASLSVNFVLQTSIVGGGTITRSPDATSYRPNTTVTLTATPTPGFAFAGWSGAFSGSANPLSITVSSDMTVTATFSSTVPDLVVDNPSAALSGTWTADTAPKDKYATDYRYTSTSGSKSATATATFAPAVVTPGRYDVYLWYPTISKGNSSTPVLLSDASGTLSLNVNQSTSSGGWKLVATGRKLLAGSSAFARFANTGTRGKLVSADGAKWVYSATQDNPTAGGAPELPPSSISVTMQDGAVVISWDAVPGRTYRVDYAESLGEPQVWRQLGSVVTPDGSIGSQADLPTDQQRFYRVVSY